MFPALVLIFFSFSSHIQDPSLEHESWEGARIQGRHSFHWCRERELPSEVREEICLSTSLALLH